MADEESTHSVSRGGRPLPPNKKPTLTPPKLLAMIGKKLEAPKGTLTENEWLRYAGIAIDIWVIEKRYKRKKKVEERDKRVNSDDRFRRNLNPSANQTDQRNNPVHTESKVPTLRELVAEYESERDGEDEEEEGDE